MYMYDIAISYECTFTKGMKNIVGKLDQLTYIQLKRLSHLHVETKAPCYWKVVCDERCMDTTMAIQSRSQAQEVRKS